MRSIAFIFCLGLSLGFGYAQHNDLEKDKLVNAFLKEHPIDELLGRCIALYQQQEYPKNLPLDFWKQIKRMVSLKKKYYAQNIVNTLKKSLSVSELTILAMPTSDKKDALIKTKTSQELQNLTNIAVSMTRPLMKDIQYLIIQELKERKVYKKNVTPENCAKFRYGKFITYPLANKLPIFMIRKQHQQIEYSKVDNAKTTFAVNWKNTGYDLSILSIYPEDIEANVYLGDTLKVTIYHIEGNTYSYQAEIRGVMYFGRVSKVPNSTRYTDYITGWNLEEKNWFMENCLEGEITKKLGKAKAKAICAFTQAKLEKIYPIPTMIPENNITEEIQQLVLECLQQKPPKF